MIPRGPGISYSEKEYLNPPQDNSSPGPREEPSPDFPIDHIPDFISYLKETKPKGIPVIPKISQDSEDEDSDDEPASSNNYSWIISIMVTMGVALLLFNSLMNPLINSLPLGAGNLLSLFPIMIVTLGMIQILFNGNILFSLVGRDPC